MLVGRRQHFWDLTRTVTRFQTESKHVYPSVVKTICSPRVCSVWLWRVCCWSPGQGLLAMFSGSCTPAFFPTAVCCCGASPSPSAPCKNSLDQLLPLWHTLCPTLRQSSLLSSALLWAHEARCAPQKKGTFSGCCNTSQAMFMFIPFNMFSDLSHATETTESVRNFSLKN